MIAIQVTLTALIPENFADLDEYNTPEEIKRWARGIEQDVHKTDALLQHIVDDGPSEVELIRLGSRDITEG